MRRLATNTETMIDYLRHFELGCPYATCEISPEELKQLNLEIAELQKDERNET